MPMKLSSTFLKSDFRFSDDLLKINESCYINDMSRKLDVNENITKNILAFASCYHVIPSTILEHIELMLN